ncbi:MAG: hypothetical protein QMD65_02705 [Patescibacteria group bacterium]|nr:hypothetical protein [Patescibacteria group bacterium]
MKKISWELWFYLFCCATAYDVSTTFSVVYNQREWNYFLRYLTEILDPSTGIALHSAFFLTIFLTIGFRYGKEEIARFSIFVFCLSRFLAGSINIANFLINPLIGE